MFSFPNILLNFTLLNLIVMKSTGDMFKGNWYMLIGVFFLSYPISACILWLVTKFVPAEIIEKDDMFDQIFDDKVTANGLRDVFVYSISTHSAITTSINFYSGDIYYIYQDHDLLLTCIYTFSILISLFTVFVEFKLNNRKKESSIS